ncbi:DUF4388 domain-containing protein [bacterium]|nr:DUF4388 domain-containing protein [bacterium]
MILEGNLGAFPFEDILKYVRDRRQSGTLAIDCAGGSHRLLFDSGRLAFLEHFQDFAWLGRGLLGAGVIDRVDYYHLLDETEGHTSEALRRLASTRDDLLRECLPAVLAAALDDELLLLTRNRDGAFRFSAEVGDVPDPLRLDAPAEGVLARCQELIAACSELLARHPHLETALFATESIADRSFHHAQLSPLSWRVLAAVNGRRRAADLVALTGLGYWQVLVALDQLLAAELVRACAEVVDDSRPALRLEPDPATNGNGRPARSWLPFRSGEEEKTPSTGPEALALFCNRLLEKTFEGEAAPDESWLPRRWSELVSRYPLADLVVVNSRHLSAQPLARWWERFCGGQAENAVLEETERALAALAADLRGQLHQRLGTRKATTAYARLHAATLSAERSPLTAARLAEVGLPAPGAQP